MNSRLAGLVTSMFLCLVVILVMLPRTLAQDEIDPQHLISLQHGDFDTRQGDPNLPLSLRIDKYGKEQDGYYIVQFDGLIQPQWKQDIQALGGDTLGYVPNNAYVVRASTEGLSAIEAYEHVQWVGIFQPAYRIDPTITARGRDVVEGDLVILTFRGVDVADVAAGIASLGGQIVDTSESTFKGKIRTSIDWSQIYAIANINGVMWIERWTEPVLHNDMAREVMDVEDTVWDRNGLYGEGQIVAVADTGLDVGANDASMHDDFEDRIVCAFAIGRPDLNPFNRGCFDGEWSDFNGHGTHVAGSVLGNGRQSGSDPDTHDYENSSAGVAPESRLVIQSLNNDLGGLDAPNDLTDLFQQAYEQGARVHTNSWGSAVHVNGEYTDRSFDADEFVWVHPDMIILFSAGNNGVDSNSDGVVDLDSISAPATAKNVITVGATENNRSNFEITYGQRIARNFRTPPISTDRMADHVNGMAAFSSRGPVDGNRIKPDVVAPGTFILSTRTHQYVAHMNAESGNGNWDAQPTWTITDTVSHDGAHSWATGPYGNNHDISLSSPTIDIEGSGARALADTLTFWTRYDLGAGDTGHVEYFRHDLITGAWLPLGCIQTIEGRAIDWTIINCSIPELTASQERNFRIRFRLESDNTDTGDGWFIDDIRLINEGEAYHPDDSSPSDEYIYLHGTSMATPLVAGAAALTREYYQDRGHDPSAALVKATLINGAARMGQGQYGGGNTQEIPDAHPNNVNGFGRVDVENALFPDAPTRLAYWDVANDDGVNHAELDTVEIEVIDASVPFQATLVWTDFPSNPFIGSPDANVINNLDLVVGAPDGNIYFANGQNARTSENNVEEVVIDASQMVTGTYTVWIEGNNVPEGPQGYALVVRAGQPQQTTPSSNADVVLIIDSSGSMGSNDPNNKRLDAGKAFLTATLAGDYVGVVDFDSGSRLAAPLQRLPDNKDSLVAAINTINSSGGTNIGIGIQEGCNALLNSTSSNSTKAAILLTDGQGSFAGQDSCFVNQQWPIYTFAFGSANDALLQQIASNTGGEFKRLPTSNLVCEFQAVRAKIGGGTPEPCTALQINLGQTIQIPISLPPFLLQATFTISWPGSDVELSLTSPSGRVVNRDTVAPDVTHDLGSTFESYSITTPESGEWTVTLFGKDVPTGGEEVVFNHTTVEGDPQSACPVDPNVVSEITSIIGRGMGNAHRSIRNARVAVPDASSLVSLYGQMAAKEYTGVRYVRFIYPDRSYVQVKPASDTGERGAISWWAADLDVTELAQRPFVKGRWFMNKGTRRMSLTRAFVLYPTHSTTEEYANVWATFTAPDNYISSLPNYSESSINKLEIPEIQAPVDVVLQFAITELIPDTGIVEMTVSAGGVEKKVSLSEGVTRKQGMLKIVELTLKDVPAGTTEVMISLQTTRDVNAAAALLGATAHYACDMP